MLLPAYLLILYYMYSISFVMCCTWQIWWISLLRLAPSAASPVHIRNRNFPFLIFLSPRQWRRQTPNAPGICYRLASFPPPFGKKTGIANGRVTKIYCFYNVKLLVYQRRFVARVITHPLQRILLRKDVFREAVRELWGTFLLRGSRPPGII